MVDYKTTVEFGRGGDDERTTCVAQNVHRDNEAGEKFILGIELGQDLGDAGGEHGGRQGSIGVRTVVLNLMERTYVMKVMAAMTAMLPHFNRLDQFNGFAGSFYNIGVVCRLSRNPIVT